MQKLFLISFILVSLALPVRRARRTPVFPISKVITDFTLFVLVFAFALRFIYGRLG
jgi:hypothetical protein